MIELKIWKEKDLANPLGLALSTNIHCSNTWDKLLDRHSTECTGWTPFQKISTVLLETASQTPRSLDAFLSLEILLQNLPSVYLPAWVSDEYRPDRRDRGSHFGSKPF
jgi:hypothetical protein